MNIDTNFLNGTRFLLALWVAVGHFYIYVGGENLYKIPILGSPGVAVDGFMIITGFLMAYQYILRESKEPFEHKSTSIKFITRRLFRLYPVYFLSIITYVVLFPYLFDYTSEALQYFNNGPEWLTPPEVIQPYSLITHLLFLHGLIPSHVVNILGPTWSLSLEMQFYLIFPAIFVYFFIRYPSSKLVPFIMASLIISLIIPKLLGMYLTKGILAHFGQPSIIFYKLPLFILGMVLASVGSNKLNWRYMALALIIILPFQTKLTNLVISFLILFMFLDNIKMCFSERIYNILLFTRKALSNKLAVLGANIAYSMYLFHMISMPFAFKLAMEYTHFIGTSSKISIIVHSFILFILFTGFSSYLSYRLIEKRFIELGRKITSGSINTIAIKSINQAKD